MSYILPEGWNGYGLNVIGIYENDNWLSNDGNSEEWCVAYMDIRNDYTISEIINIKDEKNQDNINENNDKCIVEEDDVYCTPDPKIMESNALNSPIEINGKKYIMGLMVRVKPDKIKNNDNEKNYWVLDGTVNEIRPYRILVKEI